MGGTTSKDLDTKRMESEECKHSGDIDKMQISLEEKIAELEKVRGGGRHDFSKEWQLQEEIDTLKLSVGLAKFKLENKTSFLDEDARAILGVTSIVRRADGPLQTVPTSERIDMLAKGKLIDAGGKSRHPDDDRMICEGHPNGFIAAVTAAFAQHYPLALRPQHFWLLVAQAVATHVDLNSEAVREQWVMHEGKKTLTVNCDEFELNMANNWASTVSGKSDSFAAQIATNTVAGVAEALSPPFSSTTEVEDIAQKIVVMDICKNYFDYKCSTCCGFPQIVLEGTQADWVLLRDAAGRLIERCEPAFKTKWAKSLMPLLDKLVQARKGEVDAQFWNSMCKRGGTRGSGARTWFNGWINVFFPYINRRPNHYCVPYSPNNGYVLEGLQEKFYGMRGNTGCAGPDCEDFGSGMSAAPVIWDYNGSEIKLNFNAGFVGAVQDSETFQIRPQVAWFITKSSPEPTGRDPYREFNR